MPLNHSELPSRNFWKDREWGGFSGHVIVFSTFLICKYWKNADLGMLCVSTRVENEHRLLSAYRGSRLRIW